MRTMNSLAAESPATDIRDATSSKAETAFSFKWFQGSGARSIAWNEDVIPTLSCSDAHVPAVVYCIQANVVGRSDNAGPGGKGWQENVSFTLGVSDTAHVIAYRRVAQSKAVDA